MLPDRELVAWMDVTGCLECIPSSQLALGYALAARDAPQVVAAFDPVGNAVAFSCFNCAAFLLSQGHRST